MFKVILLAVVAQSVDDGLYTGHEENHKIYIVFKFRSHF